MTKVNRGRLNQFGIDNEIEISNVSPWVQKESVGGLGSSNFPLPLGRTTNLFEEPVTPYHKHFLMPPLEGTGFLFSFSLV